MAGRNIHLALMTIFLRDYFLAVTQLQDSRLWKPVLWATLLSLGTIFVAMLIGGTLVFQMVDSFSQSLTGWMSWADGWLGGLAAFLGTFFIGMVGYFFLASVYACLLYTSPSPRDRTRSRMPSSA